MNPNNDRTSLRLSATLLLVGQILYIVVTQFHADGPANNHPVVFAEYASSRIWTAVHLGQFLCMAILLGGLFALYFAFDGETGVARWAGRFGAASAVVALALYGGLQAVDGVANKQADVVWASAADAERAARFASAEAIRWIEWGLRSYHDVTLGLAFILFAAAIIRSAFVPRSIGYLMGLGGFTYVVQGWVVGSEGFSQKESILIVIAWVLTLAWMIWLFVVARRTHDLEQPRRVPT
ncbi:MAG TPA: DUF4386 family protein [Gemmatimonadaceae bacterium]